MTLGELIKKKQYEKIVYCLRRHPIIFVKDVLIFLALATVPVGFYFFAKSSLPHLLEEEISRIILLLLGSIYYLSIWLIFFTQFIDYYLDNWIVTNDRILNIKQHALFGRTMAEMDLYKVQDATSDIDGILPTLFNYGNVHIQTAGQKERFVFEQVKDPHKIRDKILDLAEEDRKFHYHPKTR
ncbi:MAG: PH domain-containing protein [Patescibacteria group bacterium]|nr:PH domain-containing protein [Patescibacteria group bacterium]